MAPNSLAAMDLFVTAVVVKGIGKPKSYLQWILTKIDMKMKAAFFFDHIIFVWI